MNVLIIGSGGREHALAWKVAQDPRVQKVFVAPGNAGTAIEAKCENVAIDVLALEQLADFAEKHVSLTIVGPEVPLVAGVVDLFRSRGLDSFGPTAGAAQLEGSKAFTKDVLARPKIPTADYQNFTEIEPGRAVRLGRESPVGGLVDRRRVLVRQARQPAEQVRAGALERQPRPVCVEGVLFQRDAAVVAGTHVETGVVAQQRPDVVGHRVRGAKRGPGRELFGGDFE